MYVQWSPKENIIYVFYYLFIFGMLNGQMPFNQMLSIQKNYNQFNIDIVDIIMTYSLPNDFLYGSWKNFAWNT